jgi:hypothetical protein
MLDGRGVEAAHTSHGWVFIVEWPVMVESVTCLKLVLQKGGTRLYRPAGFAA